MLLSQKAHSSVTFYLWGFDLIKTPYNNILFSIILNINMDILKKVLLITDVECDLIYKFNKTHCNDFFPIS